MGLGYSVEEFGKALVGPKNTHYVREGLAVAVAYISVRYIVSNWASGEKIGGGDQ